MEVKGLKLAIAALVGLGICHGAFAAEPSSLSRTVEFERALQSDSEQYARNLGITAQEAQRRLAVQVGSAEVLEQVQRTYRDRLAGVYMEHSPSSRIVVRLTGQAAVRPQFLSIGGNPLAVEFVPGATHTRAALEGLIAKHLPALKAALPTLQGTYTDERTGEIVADVLQADVQQADRGASKQAALAGIVGAPLRLRVLPAPLQTQAVRGSANLDNGNCTGGFVVKRTANSTTGLATAAHCPDSMSYLGVDGATATLTFQAQSYNSTDDLQWHTSNATNEPKFYASATSLRTLTGRRLQSSTAVGNNICHYGNTTGYSCGDVTATNYQPTNSICNGPCAATYVALGPPSSGTGLACAGGDSGGPWFISTVAAGIHKAGSSSGTGIGQCALALYTSTDRLSSLGLQLLYGP